jgi:phenylalanyl-tRNA synthetase beta chain
MRVPLSWLREFVDVDLSPEALAERLTLLGMEVKAIERRGTDWRDVVVGELLSVERHPRADRLSLTRVTIGSGEPLEIVCGATNIAAGQRVPVALPGAVLPGDRRIVRTEKMGVVSNGMLCSGDELKLTGDADGILILSADAPLGAALADLYGDVVLDVDVKPNRGDALSIVGLAREVAAVTGGTVRLPDTALVEAGVPIAERLRVEVEDPDLCPRFVGRWVAGVRVGPSPDRVQMRLLAAGIRPISNVVDASNYVMVELGKPIHTFDAAAVHEGRIVVRVARAGERLTTLDHVDRELHHETLLIADPAGPLGIAGVMGGADSEVSDATRDVVVESAIFDPVSIRRTAFRYALRSEASLRFEKGQEHRLARVGADRTARLLADWAGGTIAPGVVDTSPSEAPRLQVAFRPARVNRLLGTTLPADQQVSILGRVGIEVRPAVPTEGEVRVSAGEHPLSVAAGADETLVATVPTWRRDIAIEADLIEEVARVRGYDLVPGTLPSTVMPAFRASPLELRDGVRAALVGAGLTEVVTHALVAPRYLERAGWTAALPVADGEEPEAGVPIRVTNPLSADHAILRQSLVASLLDVVSTNVRRGRTDVAIFEVGKGYGRVGEGTREWWRLGLALHGPFSPPAWNRTARNADLDDAKGAIELLAGFLGLGAPAYAQIISEPNLHPGRGANVVARDAAGGIGLAGRVGELHPELAEAWEIGGARVIVAELSIRGLTAGNLPVPRVAAPSRQPDAERDVAVVVTADRESGELAEMIRRSAGPLLRTVRLFDVYGGAPLASGTVSLAFRLEFTAGDRTLTEAELEGAMAAVMHALEAAGGQIRG